MRCCHVVAASGLLIAAASPVAAQIKTGYDLYRQCTEAPTDENSRSDNLECLAYIKGYIDGVAEATQLNRVSPNPIRACPGDIALGQYLLVFRRWAEENPRWLGRSAADALTAAFVSSFPCQH